MKHFLFFIILFNSIFIEAQYLPTDDFDNDGVINSVDIDDDNDGVLDFTDSLDVCDVSGAFPPITFVNGPVITNDGQTEDVDGVGNGETALYTTAGTFNGVVFDVQFKVLSASHNPGFAIASGTDDARIGLNGGTSGGNSTRRASVLVEFFETGTTTPLSVDASLRIADLDRLTYGTDPATRYEQLTVYSSQINAYVVENPTTLDITPQDSNTKYRFRATENDAAPPGDEPDKAVQLNFVGESSFQIDFLHRTETNAGVFQIDGNSLDGFFSNPDCTVISSEIVDLDTDGDGISNRFDLDSDGDGCTDANESNVLSATGSPTLIFGNVVNGNGVVNTTIPISDALVQGTYNASNGFADALQTAGDGVFTGSYTYASKALVPNANGCVCYQPGVSGTGVAGDMVGVSSLNRTSVSDTGSWPHTVENGFLVLESKEKGLVLPRIVSPESITSPIQGMIAFDTDDNCVKMYDGSNWGCIVQACVN
ncbi:hypothetical protein UJ101_01551 [Flavobacteriaceae bacterium UJ101]|nr:hypothetical protein UJ101_01551 [Flavobacteriaceae bacterium UJ101]